MEEWTSGTPDTPNTPETSKTECAVSDVDFSVLLIFLSLSALIFLSGVDLGFFWCALALALLQKTHFHRMSTPKGFSFPVPVLGNFGHRGSFKDNVGMVHDITYKFEKPADYTGEFIVVPASVDVADVKKVFELTMELEAQKQLVLAYKLQLEEITKIVTSANVKTSKAEKRAREE